MNTQEPEIKNKINALLLLSNKPWTKWEELQTKMKDQDKLMAELKALSGKSLYGKVLSVPMADGYAMYVIDKVNKSTVHITWFSYCDDYQDMRYGAGCNVSTKEAKMFDRWSFSDLD